MRVLFEPFVSTSKLVYEFNGHIINAKMRVYLGKNCLNEPMYLPEEDTFDFSSFPEGESVEIETDLPVCPIIKAEKIDGELNLVLMKFVDHLPKTQELYPKWIEIK